MRSFKKIAAMIMAVAMLCSFTALAVVETPTIETIAEITTENPTLNLSYSSDADQDTILVYAGRELSGANVVYIDQIADGSSVPEITLDTAGPFGTHTVVIGGTDVATAASTTFNYKDARPAVTLTLPESVVGGELSHNLPAGTDLTNLAVGTIVTITATPKLGYVLKSFTVNGAEKVGSVEGVSFTETLNTNTAIEVEFARETEYDTVESYTYKEWFDLAEAEAEDSDRAFASKVFFGKANGASGKTIKSMGMKVEKWNDTISDYEDVVTEDGTGPYFAANPGKIASNKYGIRFYAFTTGGKYKITSYVEYDDGSDPVEGEPIEFTVE